MQHNPDISLLPNIPGGELQRFSGGALTIPTSLEDFHTLLGCTDCFSNETFNNLSQNNFNNIDSVINNMNDNETEELYNKLIGTSDDFKNFVGDTDTVSDAVEDVTNAAVTNAAVTNADVEDAVTNAVVEDAVTNAVVEDAEKADAADAVDTAAGTGLTLGGKRKKLTRSRK